jgi:hypothetical protein
MYVTAPRYSRALQRLEDVDFDGLLIGGLAWQ